VSKKTGALRGGLAIGGLALLLAAYWAGRAGRPAADRPPAANPTAAPRVSGLTPLGAAGPGASTRGDVPPPATISRRPAPSASDAASHLAFHTTQRCYLLAARIASLKRMADCSPMNGRPGLELPYAACLNRVVDNQDRIRAAQAAMTSCGDEKTLVRRYFDATKSAAKNGDVEAQLCYVAGVFAEPDGSTHFTDEDLAEYRAAAPAYVDAALERGDWRVVAVLSDHYVDSMPLARLLDGAGEPETIYKSDALLRRGAVGDYAQTLNDAMQSLEVSPAGAAAAEDWARLTYTRSFSGSPALSAPPPRCGADADPEP
jgi:hypothetical protein